LKEAESRLAEAREAAQTSEAEFSSNADTNITLVPFRDQLSQDIANEISASLTQKGFKVLHSPWAEGIPRRGRDIAIEYQPKTRPKVNAIADIVRRICRNKNLDNKVTIEEKKRPISNNADAHVAIFFQAGVPH
jgi:hypothetical protein